MVVKPSLAKSLIILMYSVFPRAVISVFKVKFSLMSACIATLGDSNVLL